MITTEKKKQDLDYMINLLGPLSWHLDYKIYNTVNLVGESHAAKYTNILYGGSLARISRLLRYLSCKSKIFGYLGNDEFAVKILARLKEDNILYDVQKIPNATTPIKCHVYNQYSYSSYTDVITDLKLWQFRLKKFAKEILYLDPNIPSKVQQEIIADSKYSTIVLRKPLDDNLDVFETEKKLIVLLNEWEAFKIFTAKEHHYFDGLNFLTAKVLQNHAVVIDSKNILYCRDGEDEVFKLKFTKTSKQLTMVNDYFVAGTIAGIAAKTSFQTALSWGLICSMKEYMYTQYNRLEITQNARKFVWKPQTSKYSSVKA